MSRVTEAAKSVLLVTLVVASLLLTNRLWLGNSVLPAVTRGEQPSFTLPGEASDRPLPTLLAPRRVELYRDGKRWGWVDPQLPAFRQGWGLALSLLKQLGASQLQGAPQPLTAALAQEMTRAAGLAIVWPVAEPWSFWAAVLGSAPWQGPNFTVQRVYLLPEGGRVHAWLGGDGVYQEAWLPASQDVATLLRQLSTAGAEPLRALDVPVSKGLLPMADVFVPERPALGQVLVTNEVIPDPVQAVPAFFADPALARRIDGADGGTVFTDGQHALSLLPSGGLDFTAPVPERPTAVRAVAVLDRVRIYVGTHVGWPNAGQLVALQPIYPPGSLSLTGSQPAIAYRVTFATDWHGYPVLAGAGPIQILAYANGVTAYHRQVRVILDEERPQRLISAEQALATVAKQWDTLFSATRLDRRVRDVYLGYFSPAVLQGKQALSPIWLVEMADGANVMVDAATGAVRGIVRLGP